MIALHCSISLPRDYDLARVRTRVAKEAPPYDDAAGLVLFAHAMREAGSGGVTAHRYTQVSVWANTSRMGAYLWGEGGLERVRAQYGQVQVAVRPIAGLQIDAAKLATADTLEISASPSDADTPLSVLGTRAKDGADKALSSRDVHAAARCLDAQTGVLHGYDLRTGLSRHGDGESFSLLHLSAPPRP